MTAPRLTARAHALLAQLIRPGAAVADATAGNGHDTAFLARAVGATGTVYAIDIQPEALSRTRARLARDALAGRTRLHCQDHSRLDRCLAKAHRGRLAAVVFNLGYLPGSDRSVRTRPESTRSALAHAWAALANGGALSVMVYVGHDGGRAELEAVATWVARACAGRWMIRLRADRDDSPVLFHLRKTV